VIDRLFFSYKTKVTQLFFIQRRLQNEVVLISFVVSDKITVIINFQLKTGKIYEFRWCLRNPQFITKICRYCLSVSMRWWFFNITVSLKMLKILYQFIDLNILLQHFLNLKSNKWHLKLKLQIIKTSVWSVKIINDNRNQKRTTNYW
jgi:hypothetical protein